MRVFKRHGIGMLAAVALLALAGLTGCTDVITGQEGPEIVEYRTTAKFRNAHLLNRAVESASKDGNNGLGFIMRLKNGVMDKHRVLDRFRILERYRVLERFQYEKVFNGLAIEVLDSLGVNNFDDFIALLEADPDVVWFEPDVEVDDVPPDNQGGGDDDDGGGAPWGITATGADEIDRREARDVDIFVIDSGVSHRNVQVESRYDFTTNTPDAGDDTDGHGTHVAGIVAAKRRDGTEGVISRNGQVHSLKVVDADGTTALSTAIAAVEYVLGQKLANPGVPMVVNMSLGADVDTDENVGLDEAIEAAIANGVVFVLSAGNQGIDAASVSPAHVEAAITVGACGPDQGFAAFSNHGPLVDILAPGVDIRSLSSDYDADPAQTAVMSGTSMAAAHVTGAVAMFLAKNPHASPQQVRDALAASGRSLITGAPAGTTDKGLYVGPGGLLDITLPPFFQYAVTSADDIKLEHVLLVEHHDDPSERINASLFANKTLELKLDGVSVRGFGYAGSDVKPANRADAAFTPVYNPTGLPGHHSSVTQIEIDEFKAEDYQHLATRQTDGDLRLSGHYDLGTYEQPMVWYVQGNLKTDAPTTLSGYGVFLVKNSVEIKHDLTATGEDTRLALYASGNLKAKDGVDLKLSGQLFSDGDVSIEASITLTGSITARGSVEFKSLDAGSSRLYYRRPSSLLTDLIWPMGGGANKRDKAGKPKPSARRMLLRY